MNIKPVASPHQVAPTQSSPQAQRDAKARAVAAFEANNPPQSNANPDPASRVVGNATAVQAEELGAIRQYSQGQPGTDEVQGTADTVQPATRTSGEQAKDPALSRQFALLARQERQARLQREQANREIKAREQALSAKEAELNAKFSAQPDLSKYIPRDRLKEDALSVLDEAGISYEALTQQILGRQPTDPRVQATISKLEAKIAQLEEANEQSQKSAVESQQAQYNAAVKQIEMDVKAMVDSDPEFETIKAAKQTREVVKLITETYKKDGILLSNEEAAKAIEEELISRALSYTKIGKIQKRLAQNSTPAKTQASQPVSQSKAESQPQMKTLTNAASSTRKLSAKERAILAFKGELT